MRKLETERLILREFTENDLQALYELGKEPEVGINAGWEPFNTLRDAESTLYTYSHTPLFWAAALKENDMLIGTVGLYTDMKREVDEVRMLGYSFNKNYWGKGYAFEAAKEVMRYGFENLDLDIITAYCYPDNIRSRRLIEKLGFTFEGQLRMASTKWNGEPSDDLSYSILKKEFNIL